MRSGKETYKVVNDNVLFPRNHILLIASQLADPPVLLWPIEGEEERILQTSCIHSPVLNILLGDSVIVSDTKVLDPGAIDTVGGLELR
jgi:hypothetical protein